MSEAEVRTVLLDELARIAPEIDGAAADPSGDLREEFDIDSMDFLNLVTALHERLGIDIPEADYPKLFTLDDAVAYLAAHG
jgi:acyl carrier protein